MNGHPVTFRTLDIGGDKILPYMRRVEEENPALGWRAIRIGLDRPGLLRAQIRALLRGRRRARHAHHVPDGGHGGGVPPRARPRPARDRASDPARPARAAVAVARRDGRGALAAVRNRRDRARGGFPLGRLQRPDAVPLRRRPRKPLRRRPLRSALGAGAEGAEARGRRRPTGALPCLGLRRDGRAAAGGAGADRARLPLLLDEPVLGRAGEGDDAEAFGHGDRRARRGVAGERGWREQPRPKLKAFAESLGVPL